MIRLKASLAAAALGLLTLTACGEQVKDVSDKAGEVTTDVSEAASDTKDKIAETAEGAKDKIGSLAGLPASISGMTDSAKATLEAVKAGDFGAAQEQVTKMQESWAGISDQVKEKSPENHAKIEENLTALDTSLDGDAPEKDNVTTTINNLISNLKGVI